MEKETEVHKCSALVDGEVAALKEALRTQHRLLQELYSDLDEEREAASTAASEALAMILRLQEEKAAEMMEARQYKRLAEEKMHHAQESLAIFEDLMYRKEMEISSLKFQVQAYQHKLLSLGFSDLEDKSKAYCGHGDHGLIRRNTSLPILRHKDPQFEKGSMSGGRSSLPICLESVGQVPIPESEPEELVVHCEGAAKGPVNKQDGKVQYGGTCPIGDCEEVSEEPNWEDCDSYLERIEKMNEKIAELSQRNSVSGGVDAEWATTNKELQMAIAAYSASLKAGSRSCSWYSTLTGGEDPFDSVREEKAKDMGLGRLTTQIEEDCDSSELDRFISCFGPQMTEKKVERSIDKDLGVHDIFEIQQDHDKPETCEEFPDTLVLENGDRLRKPEKTPTKVKGPYEWEDLNWIKKALPFLCQERKLSTAENGIMGDIDQCLNSKNCDPSSLVEIQELNLRLKRLEGEREDMKREASERREEELKMLRDISEQLNTIQSQIKIPKPQKRSLPDEPSLVSIMEAMLSFSL
ncbi:uncharacterized protein LOC18446874 [Amborella trichopoda]|uniref:uncharacterized protein LOC18446874 n=1 Tax=Amborella trichopoda TaxID=13333 RepID=UPI0005D3674C|nr:uncharacterized protein LOC18446874 [Amborella trichopoda]XP_020530882.1 uncharacterized protein LOC18446874 [Amborella trichopoda]XP_020530883.1 uncharacterized protein LOC18446874 [Amborella trichopoda]|eukprot:XP_011628007.1 uncharacterized protein LOC18446874 [Amborella trichopoda]